MQPTADHEALYTGGSVGVVRPQPTHRPGTPVARRTYRFEQEDTPMKVLTAAPYLYRGVEVGFCDCEPGELVRLGERDECCCARYEDEEEVEAFVDEVCECHLDMDESPPFLGL